MSAKPTTKKFGKSTRSVPAPADKAKKWYNADDERESKKVSLCRATWPRCTRYLVDIERLANMEWNCVSRASATGGIEWSSRATGRATTDNVCRLLFDDASIRHERQATTDHFRTFAP